MLSVYRASMHGRYEYRTDWTFTIVPTDVVKAVVFDTFGKPLNRVTKLKKREKEIFIQHLKEFLFRKQTSPVTKKMESPAMWHIHPEFDAETKKEIQRMYLFEEL